jgi:hypothetical protein
MVAACRGSGLKRCVLPTDCACSGGAWGKGLFFFFFLFAALFFAGVAMQHCGRHSALQKICSIADLSPTAITDRCMIGTTDTLLQ